MMDALSLKSSFWEVRMFPHAIFISYIAMIFIGLQGVFLVAILLKINHEQSNRSVQANRNFILVSLGLGILYFITYYSDLVIGNYNTSLPYRLVDGMIFYAFGLSWIKVIDSFSDSEDPNMARLRKTTNILFGIFMIASSLAYGFLLDELYHTVNSYTDILMIILEFILVFLVGIFSLIYLHKARLKNLSENTRRYLIYVSAFVNISNIWNSLVVLAIFTNIMHVSILSTYSYGLTALFMLAVNSYILFYLYKTYSPVLYKGFQSVQKVHPASSTEIAAGTEAMSESGPMEPESIENKTLLFHLTERELEILKLAYGGLTNPEIAEELYISRHTVKRHMHNIFEKLNVSTRLEMVHLVNKKQPTL